MLHQHLRHAKLICQRFIADTLSPWAESGSRTLPLLLHSNSFSPAIHRPNLTFVFSKDRLAGSSILRRPAIERSGQTALFSYSHSAGGGQSSDCIMQGTFSARSFRIQNTWRELGVEKQQKNESIRFGFGCRVPQLVNLVPPSNDPIYITLQFSGDFTFCVQTPPDDAKTKKGSELNDEPFPSWTSSGKIKFDSDSSPPCQHPAGHVFCFPSFRGSSRLFRIYRLVLKCRLWPSEHK